MNLIRLMMSLVPALLTGLRKVPKVHITIRFSIFQQLRKKMLMITCTPSISSASRTGLRVSVKRWWSWLITALGFSESKRPKACPISCSTAYRKLHQPKQIQWQLRLNTAYVTKPCCPVTKWTSARDWTTSNSSSFEDEQGFYKDVSTFLTIGDHGENL